MRIYWRYWKAWIDQRSKWLAYNQQELAAHKITPFVTLCADISFMVNQVQTANDSAKALRAAKQ